MDKKRKMKWQTDLESYFDIYSSFLLDGYVEDLQPVGVGETGVDYVSLPEFLEMTYGPNNASEPKCVIFYDPFESSDHRFDIRSPYTETQEEDPQTGEMRVRRTYQSAYAQHFYDIINNDEIISSLIQHEATGVGLDMARIHYAINELHRSTTGFNALINALTGHDSGETGYLFVIKMASRLLSGNSQNNGSVFLDRDELSLFSELLKITQPAPSGSTQDDSVLMNMDRARHKFFILANKATDLPYWLYDEATNHFIKRLTVSKPTTENKREFFREMAGEFNDGAGDFSEEFCANYADLDKDGKESVIKKFIAYTSDFSMQALVYYRRYVANHAQELSDPAKIGYSITEFKSGEQVNPWDDESIVQAILNLGDRVKEDLKGQDQAIDAVQSIMTRAAVGLDRIKNPSAPRAVLFLAGPTGTGKTEICKRLANIIFGSPDRMIRFDMSEYRQEHSDQKLFGAPPGYVGYEEGGKLTNAMKAEPFSLVLFDEIEKASGTILDKFLQILSDGRLTDGKGETVSFSDSIIVMTSNAGITSSILSEEARIKADIEDGINDNNPPPRAVNIHTVIADEQAGVPSWQTYEDLKKFIMFNLRRYFVHGLGRPELYGRIFDAIVCYNFISKDVVETLCNKQIENINNAARGMFGVNVECPEEVRAAIIAKCGTEDVRANGARGINKQVNLSYESGLSEYIGRYLRGHDNNGAPLNSGMLRGATISAALESVEADGQPKIVWNVR